MTDWVEAQGYATTVGDELWKVKHGFLRVRACVC